MNKFLRAIKQGVKAVSDPLNLSDRIKTAKANKATTANIAKLASKGITDQDAKDKARWIARESFKKQTGYNYPVDPKDRGILGTKAMRRKERLQKDQEEHYLNQYKKRRQAREQRLRQNLTKKK